MNDTERVSRFNLSDDDIFELPTVFRTDLFAGKVALVTGAGTGIGKATASLFARLGASVILSGRTQEKLEKTGDLIRRTGSKFLVAVGNIRDPEQVEDIYKRSYSKFGAVDFVINNAGGQYPQDSIDFSVKGWNAVVDTNLNGTWYMMQKAAQYWRDRGGEGSIVNIVAPFQRGMPGVTHTVAARAGIVFASRNVAVEWAPLSIRVNCVVPGPILTEGMDVYPEEAFEGLKRSNLMMRHGDVQDIAEACVYLSAPSAKFVTGETLTVDGGYQIWGEMYLAGQPDYFKHPDKKGA